MKYIFIFSIILLMHTHKSFSSETITNPDSSETIIIHHADSIAEAELVKLIQHKISFENKASKFLSFLLISLLLIIIVAIIYIRLYLKCKNKLQKR